MKITQAEVVHPWRGPSSWKPAVKVILDTGEDFIVYCGADEDGPTLRVCRRSGDSHIYSPALEQHQKFIQEHIAELWPLLKDITT